MASTVRDKSGNYLVAFRWAGRQFTRSLDTQWWMSVVGGS